LLPLPLMLHKDVLIRLCQARDLLRETDDRLYTVSQAAAEIGMSGYHFIRLFKAVFGETPKQCQLAARLEKAKHLLAGSDASVTDICFDSGFSSLGTFSYVFSRRFGVSPSAFRQKVELRELTPGCISLMTATFEKQPR
jgi:AraC-like DNA-binding protein